MFTGPTKNCFLLPKVRVRDVFFFFGFALFLLAAQGFLEMQNCAWLSLTNTNTFFCVPSTKNCK